MCTSVGNFRVHFLENYSFVGYFHDYFVSVLHGNVCLDTVVLKSLWRTYHDLNKLGIMRFKEKKKHITIKKGLTNNTFPFKVLNGAVTVIRLVVTKMSECYSRLILAVEIMTSVPIIFRLIKRSMDYIMTAIGPGILYCVLIY